LERWEADGRIGDYKEVLITAIQEVGRPSFFSLLVIALSFLPIFALEAQEGKLFKPLAFTKNFAMAIAALLAITLDPAIRLLFTRLKRYDFRPRWLSHAANAVLVGRMVPEERHPISRGLFKIYGPPVHFVLRHPRIVIAAALLVVLFTIPAYFTLGHEFMPPLNEGVLVYMPTTLPGISITQASDLLQKQDAILKQVPEVERVFGKAGRADTSTDPAPLSMMETTIVLKPESQWRPKPRWYSSWTPDFIKPLFRPLWPDRMSWEDLVNDMDQRLQFPGQTNAWTMPIRNRIDMLTTGIRTPVGIKIFGADLKTIEEIGKQIEPLIRTIPGTRSVFGERASGGYFVDFDLHRDAIARYGLTIKDVQQVVMSAIGGENVSSTIEGRERYPINVRYPRELRDELEKLARILVPTPSGANIPLGQLASIRIVEGPAMIRDENGKLSGYVYIDIDTTKRDLGSYVDDAKRTVDAQLKLPAGYTLQWSGQYEAMQRVRQKMLIVVPLTLFLI
ncbi:MAG: efflux RND transporter permease subunit, partial [Thermoanaerobaculia bacterium]